MSSAAARFTRGREVLVIIFEIGGTEKRLLVYLLRKISDF
jgi:hypothetical protein